MSQKTADESAIPLCHACHQTARDSYHKLGERQWLLCHNIDLPALVARLGHVWQLLP